MIYNQNAGWGQALLNMVASQVPAMGNLFVVMKSSDSDENNYHVLQDIILPDPDGRVRFFTSLESAYEACESNNNDVILLDANGTHAIDAGIAWSKNRIHVFGMDGGDRLVQQGAKVSTAADTAEAYVIKVTGVRNSFRNVKFVQASKEATALTVAQFGGEGNLYKNCSFVFGTDTNLDGSETTTYEVVCGEDSGTFINCTFGSDTLCTTGARAVMAIDQVTSGQEMKSCQFVDCLFNIQSKSADANFIRVIASTDLKFTQLFKNCTFLAAINHTHSSVTLTDAVDSASGLDEGNILFVGAASNCTSFCSAITNNIKICGWNSDSDPESDEEAGVGCVPA